MTEKRLKNIVILDHLHDYKGKRRKIRIGRSRKAVFAFPFISKFMAVVVPTQTASTFKIVLTNQIREDLLLYLSH